MYIYRPHRELLADSLKDAKEFNTKEDMFLYIANTQGSFGNFEKFNLFGVEDFVIGSSSVSDSRTGWLDTRYVCTKRYGDVYYDTPQCVGMCATQYGSRKGYEWMYNNEVNNVEDFRNVLENAKQLVTNAELWYGYTAQNGDIPLSVNVIHKLIDVEHSITYVLSLTELFDD